MMFFVVASALLLHVLFWGVGLAMLAMPRPWRRFWPMLALPAGIALQSAVVWFGANADLRGTNSYAWPSELLPAALLGIGLWRRGLRRAGSDAAQFGLVGGLVVSCLALLVLPMAIASHGLSTVSLGNNDAPDYAAGARTFMEFAHSDRTGFLGLTEVVRTMTADNFFDFWLRLNHFTPSALIALNGTILGCAPHELTGILTALLVAAALPLVFWMARAVIGYSAGVSLGITAIYSVSPILWYAVALVAPGQLLAALAVALISWSGIALWRGRLSWRRAGQFSGVLLIAYWILLGGYNFFVIVCLVPAVAFAGGAALWKKAFGRLVTWAAMMLSPLAVCGLVFYGRVSDLVERFLLFRTYDFGWKVPAFTPEGWLGIVSGPLLAPWSWGGIRWVLTAGVIALLGWSGARAVRDRRIRGWVAISLFVPVLVGYTYLEWRGHQLATNASYDAYKLFAVFYPGILPAVCWWVTLRRSRRLGDWLFVVVVASVVLLGNLVGTGMIFWRVCSAPLRVDGELRQLRKIEARPEVHSINMMIPDMWSRLWANAFLLRKPQYFLTDTYEGRWATPLRGEWDLQGGLVTIRPAGDGFVQVTPHYSLADTRAPGFVRAVPADGWNQEEFSPRDGERWRWTRGDATLRVENPGSHPSVITCTFDGWTPVERDLILSAETRNGKSDTPPVRLGSTRTRVIFAPLTIPPGGATLRLHSPQPATTAGPGDGRTLGECVFGLELATGP